MKKIGVIEGFFGPQWNEESRNSYSKFLKKYGGEFYIYAPKEDPYLRKKWREEWPIDYINKLKKLVDNFHQEGILFGVGFSPFGLGETLTSEDQQELEKKLGIMNSLGIDLLGLFFDDMPVKDNLAATQVNALNLVEKSFANKIIFCPSYYTYDPILDRVFGNRPPHYLEDIAAGASEKVALVWTGPKVISPEISAEHLDEVTQILKREPFIWENFFANDGPKNCKFLKLKPYSGRTKESFNKAEGFGFNLMNQAELSKLLFLASKYVADGEESDQAFSHALKELVSSELGEFITFHKDLFCTKGLDQMSEVEKDFFINSLNSDEKMALEIKDWLQGKYTVGSECLTD